MDEFNIHFVKNLENWLLGLLGSGGVTMTPGPCPEPVWCPLGDWGHWGGEERQCKIAHNLHFEQVNSEMSIRPHLDGDLKARQWDVV